MAHLTPETEQQLITDAQNGDKNAFGQLFKTHYQRVYRVCYSILGDPDSAQEATQQTWIKAWEKRQNYNAKAAYTTWLHRIASNTAIDHTRKRKRYWQRIKSVFTPSDDSPKNTPDPADTLPPDERTPLKALLNKDNETRLADAIATLPQPQREVFLLRELEDMRYQDIADELQINLGTVMSRLHLARKKLQTHLSQDPS